MREVRELQRAGKLDEAWQLFEQSPPTAVNLLDGARVARAKFHATVGAEGLMWLHRAHGFIERAASALRGEPDLVHVETHFFRARIELDVGDGPHGYESLGWLQKFGSKAAGMVWPLIAPDADFMLGLLYEARGEKLLAWHHYCEAERLAEQEGQHEVRLRALLNLSWLALGDANREKAEELLAVLDPLVVRREIEWHRELRRAYLQYVQGDLEAAIRLLTLLYDQVRSGPVSREGAEVLAWACWLSGRVALSVGALGDAQAFCNDGTAWSVQGGDAFVMTELSRLRASISERQAMASDD